MLHILSETITPLGMACISVVGLWLLGSGGRIQRSLRALCWLALVGLFVLATPFVSTQISAQLTAKYPMPSVGTPGNHLIIVLGGAVDTGSNRRAQLGPSGDRLLLASHLYQKGFAKRLLISGGSVLPSGGNTTSEDFAILQQLGVPASALVDETQSRTTAQNAQFAQQWTGDGASAQLFDEVYLVTSALHMPRAVFEFCQAGVTCVDCVSARKQLKHQFAMGE